MPIHFFPHKTPYTATASGAPEGVLGYLRDNTRKESLGTLLLGEWVENVPFLGEVTGVGFRLQARNRFFGMFDPQVEGTVEPGSTSDQALVRFELGRLTWRGRLALWGMAGLMLLFLVSTLSFQGSGFALTYLLVMMGLLYGLFLLLYNRGRAKMLELMAGKLLLSEVTEVQANTEDRRLGKQA